jgi:hypothetical protein
MTFRQFLREAEAKATAQDATVDFTPQPTPHDIPTTDFTPSPDHHGEDGVTARILQLLRRIDPFLSTRANPRGNSMRGAMGSPHYMAPEIAARTQARRQVVEDNEHDAVESFLKNSMELFPPFFDNDAKQCLQAWLQFRALFHPPTEEGTSGPPNFVLYKSTKMRYDEIVPILERVNNEIMSGTGNHDPALSTNWTAFYQRWQRLAPRIAKMLDTFMANHPDPHNLGR